MKTITIEIPDRLASLFESICLENQKIKQEVVKELLIQYIEDIEDIADARRILALNEPTISLVDIERKYGLAD